MTLAMIGLGDVVELQGRRGRVIEVCPDVGDLILQQRTLISVPLAEAYRCQIVARGSLLSRYAMRLRAFALRVRDCGWRYAFG
jgi:hypothetical protein